MKAIRKKAPMHSDSARDRSEQAAGFNRISGMTIRSRAKNVPYPEVWGYIRPKQAENAFECHQCAQKFASVEQLRQHEVDCGTDDANEAL